MKIRWTLFLCVVCAFIGIIYIAYTSQSNKPILLSKIDSRKAASSSLAAWDTTTDPSVSPSTGSRSVDVPVAQAVQMGSVDFTAKSNHPISVIGGHQVAYPGPYAGAHIVVGGQSYDLSPNQVGAYPRIYIEPKAQVSVQMNYPELEAGTPVAVEVEDGGQLSDKKMGEVFKLDSQNTIQFQFLAGNQEGIYRLVLRSGGDVKTVNLWVGQEAAAN